MEHATEKRPLRSFIERRKFEIALGLLTMIGGGYFGAWITKKDADLTFITFPSETVARKDFDRLSVKWDDRPIPSLCVTRIGIANRGEAPVGQGQFTHNDPLRIVASTPVNILSVEAVNVSRRSLDLSTAINEKHNVALISVNGNDALERGDGVLFRVLFSGECSKTTFEIHGRVVGQKDGPRAQVNYKTVQKDTFSIWQNVLMLFATILLSMIYADYIFGWKVLSINTAHMGPYLVSGIAASQVMNGCSIAVTLYRTMFDSLPWLP